MPLSGERQHYGLLRFLRAPGVDKRHSEELDADTNLSGLLGNCLRRNRQVKSL